MADDLELIEDLTKSLNEFKTKQKKELEDLSKKMDSTLTKKELDEKQAEAKAWVDDLLAKVAAINTDIAAKGATVAQLQDELKEFKAKKGRFFTGDDVDTETPTVKLLKDAFKEHFEKLREQANEPRAEYKFKLKEVGNMLMKASTMTAANSLTGSVMATYAGAPAIRARQKLHIRDLLNVIPSATGLWKFYRENTPAPNSGSFDFQTTHGNVKNQLDYALTEVTITVDYLAGFLKIAKQMLQDLPFMQSFVSGELVEDYLRAEDLKFFGQLYSAATGAGTITATVTVEKIIQMIANIGDLDYDVNGIVVTNQAWSKMLRTKPNDYSIPGGVTITPNGDVAIVGIPVFRTKASYLGNDGILVGDWTKAAIIQTEGLNVNIYEQDSDNVQRNLLTCKAEARVALATLRPDAFGYTTAGTT